MTSTPKPSQEPSLDALIAAQQDYLDQILKIWINFKKLALPKRTRSAVENRLQTLDTFWKGCLARHDEILLKATREQRDSHEYFVTDAFSSITESADEVRDALSEVLDAIQVSPAAPGNVVSAPINPLSSHPISLPPINIPTFSGELTAWPAFRDLFSSLVASRVDFSNVQKLHYLKGSLSGQAAQVLRSTDITEANYTTAWELLHKRYDNPRAIVYAHLDKFQAIPKVSPHSVRDLRQLRDQAHEIYHALLGLKRPIDHWEDQYIHSVLTKLDAQTRHEWELTLKEVNNFPSFSELDEYLSFRLRALEASGQAGTGRPGPNRSAGEEKRGTIRTHQASASGVRCFVCQGDHLLFQCPTFARKPVQSRIDLLREENRCLNCFRRGHRSKDCPNKNVCRLCKRRHNTLVHVDAGSRPSDPPSSPPPPDRAVSTNCARVMQASTILPTATVIVRTPSGRSMKVRALLDQGSQASFLSQSVVQILNPQRLRVCVNVSGFGSKYSGLITQAVEVCVEARQDDCKAISLFALVFPRLSSYIPPPGSLASLGLDIDPAMLADQNPFSYEPIQLIIGADYYGSLLRPGLLQGPPRTPVAQFTLFGWIISGLSASSAPSHFKVTVIHIHVDDELLVLLKRFWELEEVPKQERLSEEELRCEQHFQSTHSRLSDGRYSVRLPFKTDPPLPVGSSKPAALRLLLQQEKRLSRNPELQSGYQAFLHEYLALGHMERVPAKAEHDPAAVYIPHHSVLKNTNATTKLRVVFNASFRYDSGSSLNDHLMVGPKLQADLSALLLRWRAHCFVYSTDLEKMFRQIRVHPEDADCQRILWRHHPQTDVATFRLCTVTYGTSCAPFLANRVLKQLADDEGSKYPAVSDLLRHSVYVDDIMFGADDIPTLRESRDQLCRLLTAGGFRPYKWTASHPHLLADIPDGDLAASATKLFEQDSALKVLGIHWEPKTDGFSFQVTEVPPVTSKRTFLSLLARIFDPHGWVAPVTIAGKILLQCFWLRKVAWDDPFPPELAERCTSWQAQLATLNHINIPRWTGQRPSDCSIELHGFCDASNSAYSAVVYMRIQSPNGEGRISLLLAKTKVAPVKVVSVPRLELCGAHLLARALVFVIDHLTITDVAIFCWTDSTVVLCWLSSHPSSWKPFVAHRVSAIQTALPTARWRYVPTSDNPADCASRGITSQQLIDHSLWWTGPSWLSQPPISWPNTPDSISRTDEAPERRAIHLSHVNRNDLVELAENISSWPRLLRVTAYVRRFTTRLRNPKLSASYLWLTALEIRDATRVLLRLVQRQYFPDVVDDLTSKEAQGHSRRLRNLDLYMDSDGIVRVGGRLRHADLPTSEKFPVLLPPCRVSYLLALHAHTATLHGGPQVSLRFLRQRYWVVNARSLLKRVCFNCVTCTRQRAATSHQRMGDLPASRVTPARPFAHTGVDYAGPFLIRASKGRGVKTHKAFCAVFVCLAVKAIHLECVDDISTAGFLAAFDRFTARRGLPEKVYSDNGTNFVGAERELSTNLRKILEHPELLSKCASDGIEWRFIPPAAPHFGGLWEAGVKSVKFHLRRIIGQFTPTYAEFSTLLCKIEGILNSRPIAPLHDDPDTFDALTPGHFLVGSYLRTPPTPSVLDVDENRLTRWQTVQRCSEIFWKIWSSDYLNSLRQRVKWHKQQPNLQVGDLVLLKNPHLPPSKWELGRVSKCFPGQDQLTRVVNVRTARSEYKRPVTQICKLPVDTRTVKDPPLPWTLT